jgi:hypothetical protein
MVVPLVAVLMKGLSLTLWGYRDFLEDCPVDVIVFRALKGKEAVYPFGLLASYGAAVLGAGIYERGRPRFRTLDAVVLMPPAFTPGRLKKAAELLRGPSFMDVKTDVGVGGFSSSLPVVVGSMGSRDTASKTALTIARGAARAEGYNIVANRRQALRRGTCGKELGARRLVHLYGAALARGEKDVENYIESLKVEIQMFTSVLGKYDVKEIS